jgi:hypothetical protein
MAFETFKQKYLKDDDEDNVGVPRTEGSDIVRTATQEGGAFSSFKSKYGIAQPKETRPRQLTEQEQRQAYFDAGGTILQAPTGNERELSNEEVSKMYKETVKGGFWNNLARAVLPRSLEISLGFDVPTTTREIALNNESAYQASRRQQETQRFVAEELTYEERARVGRITTGMEEVEEPGFVGQFADSFRASYFHAASAFGGAIEAGGIKLNSPGVIAYGKKVSNFWQAETLKHPEWFEPAEWGDEQVNKWKDPRLYSRFAGAVIPSIAGTFASASAGAMVGGPPGAVVAGGSFIYALEAGSAYNGMIEQGVAPSEASTIAGIYGSVAVALEGINYIRIGSQFFRGPSLTVLKEGYKRELLVALPKTIGIEMGTEGLQQFSQNVASNFAGANVPLFQDVMESTVAGAVGGAVFGGVEVGFKAANGTFRDTKLSDPSRFISENQPTDTPGAPASAPIPNITELTNEQLVGLRDELVSQIQRDPSPTSRSQLEQVVGEIKNRSDSGVTVAPPPQVAEGVAAPKRQPIEVLSELEEVQRGIAAGGDNVEELQKQAAKLSDQLTAFEKATKTSALRIPAPGNDKALAEVEVVRYGDGKYAYRYSISVTGYGSSSLFQRDNLVPSPEKAVLQATSQILEVIRSKMQSGGLAPSVRTSLTTLADKLQSIQNPQSIEVSGRREDIVRRAQEFLQALPGAAELFEGKVSELQQRWQSALEWSYANVETELQSEISALEAMVGDLQGERGTEARADKSAAQAKLQELQDVIGEVTTLIEEDNLTFQAELGTLIIERGREAGMAFANEEAEQEFRDSILYMLYEPPGVERFWTMTVAKMVDTIATEEIAGQEAPISEEEFTSEVRQRENLLNTIYGRYPQEYQEAISGVLTEMGFAEAGSRIFIEDPRSSTPEVVGISSTFPQYVPEALRSKELFNKVIAGLIDGENIVFPQGTRSRQRALYNAVFDEVDSRLQSGGIEINTSSIRENIIELYDANKETRQPQLQEQPAEPAAAAQQTEAQQEQLAKPGSERAPGGEGAASVAPTQKAKRVEFRVGDVLDPQGNTNMVGRVTIREIQGNTLKFEDAEGTEFSGMQRSLVRTLVEGGSWKVSADPRAEEARQAVAEGKSLEEFIAAQELQQTLRGTKGLTADQIMKTYPNIKLTQDVAAKDVYGNKVTIDKGEALTPYEMKDGKIVLQDGETYVVSKNQFANIKGNAVGGEAKPFAPELAGLEETVKGGLTKEEAREVIKKGKEEVYGIDDNGVESLIEGLNDLEETGFTRFALGGSFAQGGPAKYGDGNLVLPGGKNYKEILITAPVELVKVPKIDWVESKNGDWNATVYGKDFTITPEGSKFYVYEKGGQLGQTLNTLQDAQKVALDYAKKNIPKTPTFLSSHWDSIKNVLAHLRLNDRTYKGKKVTFMEEAQSDWARKAREEGYYGLSEAEKAEQDKLNAIAEKGNAPDEVKRRLTELNFQESNGVPFNPLLKDWLRKVAVPRALQEAVANNSEYFAWITGEQTSARYNLATQVNKVTWQGGVGEIGGGNKSVMLDIAKEGNRKLDVIIDVDKDGKIFDGGGDMPAGWEGKKLNEVLGKGLADKIMADETGTLSGEGLKFGGEWAINLYDKQVGNIVADLTGAKVEVLDMGLPVKGKTTEFYRGVNTNLPPIKPSEIKVGMEVYPNGDRAYIITDILGEGKFKAVSLDVLEQHISPNEVSMFNELAKNDPTLLSLQETFDISTKLTTQQGIRLTPEIKARILGEAPAIQTSGEKFEDTTARLTEIYNEAVRTAPVAESAPTEKPAKMDKETKEAFDSIFSFNPKNLARKSTTDPAFIKETDKVVKRSEIASYLSERLNVPIRNGKYRIPNALGIYKHAQQVVRVKAGGLDTIVHEVAHYLDDTVSGFRNQIPKGEVQPLMKNYGGKPSGDRLLREAFAEFVRYRTMEPGREVELAPGFAKYFEAYLATLPEIRSVLNSAREDVRRWNSMPASAKVMSQISTQEERAGIKDRVKNSLGDLYTNAVEDLYGFTEFTNLSERALGKKIPAEESPIVLATLSRGWTGKAETFLTKGTFGRKFWDIQETRTRTKTGRIKIGKKTVPVFTGRSFQEIVQPVEKLGALEDFRIYLVAKRAVELAGRGIQTGIDVADARTTVSEMNARYPEFERQQGELLQYQDALMTYLLENGMIDDTTYAKIKELNRNYVPFYRVYEETQAKGYMGKGFANVRSGIKRIRGSEREIIDPLESIVKNTYTIINAVERNNVVVATVNLANQAPEMGRIMEEIPAPQAKVATITLDEVGRAFGLDTKNISKEVKEATMDIFRPSFIAKDNSVSVLINGKQKWYHVADTRLYNAIQGLEVEQVAMLVKLFSYPAKFLRAGATLTPDFVVRNPFRDQWSAMVYSKYGYVPFFDMGRGLFGMLGKDDDYWLWRMGGGELSTVVALDRENLQRKAKDIVKTKGAKDYILDPVKNPLAMLQFASSAMENATRIGEAKKALWKAQTPQEAAISAKEITLNFARIGAKTRAVNSIIAFFNAQVQDIDKIARTFKNPRDPRAQKALRNAVIGITLPSIILYFVNRDDPRWKEIPRWQKDLFWIVPMGDTLVRIPKPFSLGLIFGTFPERVLEYIDTQDPRAMEQFRDSLIAGFSPSTIPTALLPYIESITNHSFFLGRDLVPEGRQDLPNEAQYTRYTSESAKLLGRAFDYAPAKIDNWINGYFGGLGRYAVQAADKILRLTGVTNPVSEPERTLADTPVIRGFVVREPIGSSSESVNAFYDKYEVATKSKNFYSELAERGENTRASQYYAEHPEIDLQKHYAEVARILGQLRQARDAVLDSDISSDQKRRKADEFDRLMTQIARDAITIKVRE